MEKSEYLEGILNSKQLLDLINMLQQNKEYKEINVNNIQFGDKEYIIFKNNNSILIKCSDGRALEIKIDISEANYDNQNKYYYDIKIINDLLNGAVLLINKTISQDENKDIYLDKFNIFDDDCNIFYFSRNNDSRHLIWNEKENLFNYKYGITHDDNIYIFYDGKDKYLISKDFNKIISFNDQLLPDRKEVDSFNKEEEKNKLKGVLDKYQLNMLTRNLIIELINNLDKKEKLVDQIKKAYNETVIPKCKQIIKQEIELNKDILNSILKKEELMFIISYLENNYINKNSK